MQAEQQAIYQLLSQIIDEQYLPYAVKSIEHLLQTKGITKFDTRLDEIKSSYQLMKDYMLRGYQDPMRPQLYDTMLHQLYALVFDLRLHLAITQGGYHGYAELSARQIELSGEEVLQQFARYVQDLAMLSLEPQTTRKAKAHELRRQHQRYLSSVFDAIVVSPFWNEAVYEAMLKLLCSPMIDSFDAQTLVSAVTLSGINLFDPLRFKLLLEVWRTTDNDEELRQRAFVGWTVVASSKPFEFFPASVALLKTTIEDADATALRSDLYALQCQIFYCSNARRDNEKMQKDIIPTLMKGQQMRFNRFGVEEKEDDSLEDILHPDKAEQDMERAEESMQRMMEMQKQGADIYFGGFSQMKRFPFFSSVSNWFLPFSKQNPDMEEALDKLGDTKLVDTMLGAGPFCSSDKYSFGFALKMVYDQLPANVREMMNGSDNMFVRPSSVDANQLDFKRLQYLQDLYRFFELNTYRSEFRNPFWTGQDATLTTQFFMHSAISLRVFYKEIVALMNFALKRKEWELLNRLIRRYQPSEADVQHLLHADGERLQRYYRLCYALYNHEHDDSQAYEASRSMVVVAILRHEEGQGAVNQLSFDKASQQPLLPENMLDMSLVDDKTLRCYAASALRSGHDDEALRAYQLLYVRVGDKQLLWYQSLALMHMKRYDEALQLLYPLDLETENLSVKRTIAWILLLKCKPQQAECYYDDLIGTDGMIDEDYLNAGYSKWFQNKNNEAVILFKSWLGRCSRGNIAQAFMQDHELLADNGITYIDRMLMEDLVETS